MLNNKDLILKWLKRTLICIFIILFVCFALYKPKGINLEGSWKVKEIVLNGKKNYPDAVAKFIDLAPEILVNPLAKTISIPIDRKNVTAKFQYINNEHNQQEMRLCSTEESLNGIFAITVDTVNTGPQSYLLNVELKSDKTVLKIQKHVIIMPRKPQFPRRGRP